ncbi:ABC transporter ATP-binding protein [Comamonadaceae bacterium M7527]|nr:ABC transporter ATP-binding protein [Comamonadaceae bacterium M7527]
MSQAALLAQAVSVRLSPLATATPALAGVDVCIAKGCWTSVVGPNGAGKSTLLKVLAGLLPHTGHVQLMGKPLASWPARERAMRLAWLGQSEYSSDDLSVADVVMLGRLPHQGWLAPPSAQDHAVVQQALQTMHAWAWRSRRLSQLSGGERQRVLLARALAVQADVLLMDEPLANLDPPHQADWLKTVRQLTANGTTVVSVLHEIGMALQADHMLVLRDGQVAHAGNCAEPRTHQALVQVFDNRIAVHAVDGQWVVLPR